MALKCLGKLCRKRTINRPMIGGKCHRHNGRHLDLTVLDHSALFTRTNCENSGMRWIDDRRKILDAEHAKVGNSSRSTLIFFWLQFAIPRTLCEVFHLV